MADYRIKGTVMKVGARFLASVCGVLASQPEDSVCKSSVWDTREEAVTDQDSLAALVRWDLMEEGHQMMGAPDFAK